ncbi:hypothetical protein [Spiroplasma endosymbiont of Ammophila pubescens]|uniref:hypothetical protein n=1 Tax=Spiroplasma endosymbiont of Ammophila pubescens TaxID=3066315 RepID=UPI0032B22BAC
MKNKSLFNLDSWTEDDVQGILTTALQFKNNEKKVNYQQTKIVANLFSNHQQEPIIRLMWQHIN